MKKKLLLLITILVFLTSCKSKKEILYFQDIQNKSESEVIYTQNKIQVNDILTITVSALNPDSALPYNSNFYNNYSNLNSENAMKLNGYLVNNEGFIVFPILGKIEVKGKTTNEVEDLIINTLKEKGQLTNPIVNVRITNAKITILGDISNPGTYPYYEQNLTLLQALGYAGDLNLTGKRNEILIIREENGKRNYRYIDLRKTDWFNSPYYYIKQNDIIYVNPNGAKIQSAGYITNLQSAIGLLISVITLTIIITR